MKHCPKYLQELYGPISHETWQAWLAYQDQAKAILCATDCDWSKARAFYDAAGDVCGTLGSSGMGRSSTLKTKRPFPWCGVHLSISMLCRSISLDVETSDSDTRIIAEYRED